MPNDPPALSQVSLSIPHDLIEAYDRLATALERSRSWVMVRALRCYLEEEGAEVFEDSDSLAELDRGEVISSEEMHRRLREIIAKGERGSAQKK